jgi:hypothetical protein
MKIHLHVPAMFAEIATDAVGAADTARGQVFARLSTPAIYENRIHVGTKALSERPRYPYKRADESVN